MEFLKGVKKDTLDRRANTYPWEQGDFGKHCSLLTTYLYMMSLFPLPAKIEKRLIL